MYTMELLNTHVIDCTIWFWYWITSFMAHLHTPIKCLPKIALYLTNIIMAFTMQIECMDCSKQKLKKLSYLLQGKFDASYKSFNFQNYNYAE